MPLLDSFTVDHTKMHAPAVRLAKNLTTPKGDIISIFDLRFVQPNKEILCPKAIHTMEHLFAGFMRIYLEQNDSVKVIDISPMGCRTGFYMCVIGEPCENTVKTAWLNSMNDILEKIKEEKDIPELNEFQCGSYKEHSLAGARAIAKEIVEKGIKINFNQDLKLDVKYLQNL